MASSMYIYFPGTDALSGTASAKEVDGDKAIQIKALTHGVTMSVSGAGTSDQARHHGRTSHRDIQFQKYTDQTTPQFNEYCSGGNIIPKAIIQFFHAMQSDAKSTPSLFWQCTVTDVIITSVQFDSSGFDVPTDTITLNYMQIEWMHNLQNNKAGGSLNGPVTTTWKLDLNTI